MNVIILIIFLFSVGSNSDEVSYPAGNRTSSELKCLFNGHIKGLKCFSPELPKLPSTDYPLWNSFLGIGPSKTGSSSLFEQLGKHKKVVIGNSTAGGRLCCYSELYYFTKMEDVEKGIIRYKDFYTNADHVNAEAVGEKTPFYFSHPLVPYRARALLSKSLKLILTYRDPVEADISLYFHREMASTHKMAYYEWLYPRLDGLKKWVKCREIAFKSLLVQNSTHEKDYFNIRDLHNPNIISWETAQNIEIFLLHKCEFPTPTGNVLDGLIYHSDYLQERLSVENLKRWVHVFGKENMICIKNDDQLTNAQNVLDEVTNFLGVNPDGWDGFKPENYHPFNITHRLLESQRKLNSDAVNGMIPAMNALRDFLDSYETKEEKAWFQDICGFDM